MAPFSRYALTTLALFALGAVSAPLPQLAGEGAAANSILSDTDNGVGYGVEDAEDNLAGNVETVKGTAGGAGGVGGAPAGPGGPPPPARARRAVVFLSERQLDKISNGAGTLIDATGVPIAGGVVQSTGDSIDGSLTGAAANAGAQVGGTEESTLETAGSSVPKH